MERISLIIVISISGMFLHAAGKRSTKDDTESASIVFLVHRLDQNLEGIGMKRSEEWGGATEIKNV